jgi:hypothetical protein
VTNCRTVRSAARVGYTHDHRERRPGSRRRPQADARVSPQARRRRIACRGARRGQAGLRADRSALAGFLCLGAG